MRVLMLGWEFPPHISGGLGTACLGLTRGLAHHGVDVTFVLPRVHGDEDRGATRLIGCDDVALPGEADVFDPTPPAPPLSPPPVSSAAPAAGAPAAGARAAPPAARMRFLSVDSPLSPYLSPEAYRRWAAERTPRAPAPAAPAARAPAVERTAEAVDSPPSAAPSVVAVAEPPEGPHRVQVSARNLSFSGFYGPDLMSEVARYAAVVESLAATETFDVVHAHDWMTYPAGIAVSRASGKPLVVHVHACEWDRSPDRPNAAIVAIEREGLAAADLVIAVSHYTAAILEARYGVDAGKVRVVHNAVTHREQVEGWHVGKAIDEPIVLFLGRVTSQKGPSYFLEAAARVVRAEPHVKFVVSGSGDRLPETIEQAARLGLARHVHFTGFLSGPDVERMYAMADVYVMPSVSEPFGIAPLEAMALDVPVIVSRQSGVSEVLASALKFDYWDVEDLADKILAVLKRRSLREHLAKAGHEEVRSMRWEARAARVLSAYREALA